MDISLIWAGIIALGVLLYVILDGFDLGVGILLTCFKENGERDLMIASVAPVWDGNETWLVLGGAALLAAFPVVYAAALPALYIPLFLMLMCLILRGASIELRFCSARFKELWNRAFMIGSIGASFFQGISLGAWVIGFRIIDREYAGGSFDWLTPFSVFTGVGLILTYALLGCGYLIYRTEGPLQKKLFRIMTPINLALLMAIVIICIWTALYIPKIRTRWLFSKNSSLSVIPILLLCVISLGMHYAIRKKKEIMPFFMGLALVVVGYVTLLVSLWPNLIPPNLSIWDAAAPIESQKFSLIGVAVVLPVVIAYTFYTYWVFRGKVKLHDFYHENY